MYKNEHKFPYRWTKKDANFTKDKGKVMSCFCCGGGSSFGYKLAGYDVVACNEIDPKVMKMYLKNHDVKYSFNCDIRELIANINMGGHPMQEEPKLVGEEIIIDEFLEGKKYPMVQKYMVGVEFPPTIETIRWISNWDSFLSEICDEVKMIRWCYFKDLLPKEGGEQ